MKATVQNNEIDFNLKISREELTDFFKGVNYFLGKAIKEQCSPEEMEAIGSITNLKDAFTLSMYA